MVRTGGDRDRRRGRESVAPHCCFGSAHRSGWDKKGCVPVSEKIGGEEELWLLGGVAMAAQRRKKDADAQAQNTFT